MKLDELFNNHRDKLTDAAITLIETTEQRILDEFGEFASAQEFNDFVAENYPEFTRYQVKDWDGSMIFRSDSLEEVAYYFNIDKVKDETELKEEIEKLYDRMKTPSITRL